MRIVLLGPQGSGKGTQAELLSKRIDAQHVAMGDIVRAEIIAGNGYPYAIETADAVSVISMQDRNEFYAHFQAFMERQGVKFTFSTKSLSKNRRR